MSEDTQALAPRSSSRRAFLFGGLATAAAVVAQAAANARPALAAGGDPVTVDGSFTGVGTTLIQSSGDELAAIAGLAAGSGSVGVHGEVSTSGGVPAGVFGNASSPTAASFGIMGRSRGDRGTGVGARAPSPTGPTFGVHSLVQSPDGVGVYTESARGQGVAMRAVGRVRFSTSGIATIAKGSKSVRVNPAVVVGSSSKVLCTLQSSAGGATTIHRVAKDTAADRFTIYLTANASVATKVAWFLID